MDTCGFEIHDAVSWREHYAPTTRFWFQRLEVNKEKAVSLVAENLLRKWPAYLAGVSFAFDDFTPHFSNGCRLERQKRGITHAADQDCCVCLKYLKP